jgi:hypothetical protein
MERKKKEDSILLTLLPLGVMYWEGESRHVREKRATRDGEREENKQVINNITKFIPSPNNPQG